MVSIKDSESSFTFASMESTEPVQDPTPPGYFRLDELEALQSCENQVLTDVNYYLWLNKTGPGELPLRFLYCLELVFESREPLLLSSGEDSEAICLPPPADLVKTARQLQTLHGQLSIQRVNAGAFPLWEPVAGRALEAIRLSKDETGLYLNDALLLDFGVRQIAVQLGPKEGLEVGLYA